MNKLFLFLIAVITSAGVKAQDSDHFQKVYHQFADRKDAFALTLSKQMLDAVDMEFDWQEQVKHVSGDIYEVRFIVFGETDNGNEIVKKFHKEIMKSGYPVLPADPDKKGDLKFFRAYGREKNGFFNDIHLLIQDEDGRAYFFSLNGKLKVASKA